MKTCEIAVNGILVIVPEQLRYQANSMYSDAKTYSYCGAGRGLGDKAVPETIWGLRITLACLIHDECFDIAEATWADFHLSNSMFLHNLIAIIEHHGGWLRLLRNYRAITYFNAVDSVGASVFKKLKGME